MRDHRITSMEEIMNDEKKRSEKDEMKEGTGEEEEAEENIVLPGFRFHPTDEELVGFYLRRKVEKKPLRIEVIKQIDIYKYDPWDLPKEARSGSSGGDVEKEWYFFCIRGRKYRNSIRPNRVTGSGFWKATGIDKGIHSVKEPHHCIGLKKSLVYYRGTAGKGTKTDWMMHEFRLPPPPPPPSNGSACNPNHLQEAEVWTLCRIFKRIPSYKKYTPSLKDTAAAAAAVTTTKPNNYPTNSSNSKTCSLESDNNSNPYLTTSSPFRTSHSSSAIFHQQQQHNINNVETKPLVDERSHLFLGHLTHHHQPPSSMVTTNYHNPTLLNHHHHHHHQSVEDVFANGNWDELTSVVQFAVDYPSTIYDCTLNR